MSLLPLIVVEHIKNPTIYLNVILINKKAIHIGSLILLTLNIDYCNKNYITQSMNRKGNCWDNAVIERFFRSLKTERLNYQSSANHFEVVQNVESYIYFYNYKRIHGYLTPTFILPCGVQKMVELEKVA